MKGGNPDDYSDCDAKDEIERACRLIGQHFAGDLGIFAYRAFDYINENLFEGELPCPLIVWALTAHGGCLGYTASAYGPLIVLHPSLLGGSETRTPWGVPTEWLGWALAYDQLIHECIHLKVKHRLGGYHGPTSHNNREWIGEVNRLAPLLGFGDIGAGLSRTKRVDGKVCRVTDGNVPFIAVSGFPLTLRMHIQQVDVYLRNELPFPFTGALPLRDGAIPG